MGDSKGVDPEQRADAAGRNLIVAPVREHSRKPDAGRRSSPLAHA
jgi:hypothetical protein